MPSGARYRRGYRERDRRVSNFETMRATAPACLSKIIMGAVEFARSFGFSPHPDFRHAAMLLDGIDPSACPNEFTFGRDGRPLYIQGPNESLAEAAAIITRPGSRRPLPCRTRCRSLISRDRGELTNRSRADDPETLDRTGRESLIEPDNDRLPQSPISKSSTTARSPNGRNESCVDQPPTTVSTPTHSDPATDTQPPRRYSAA